MWQQFDQLPTPSDPPLTLIFPQFIKKPYFCSEAQLLSTLLTIIDRISDLAIAHSDSTLPAIISALQHVHVEMILSY